MSYINLPWLFLKCQSTRAISKSCIKNAVFSKFVVEIHMLLAPHIDLMGNFDSNVGKKMIVALTYLYVDYKLKENVMILSSESKRLIMVPSFIFLFMHRR